MVGFYATEEEAAAMMEAAKSRGMTLADWMRSLIATEEPTPPPKSSKRAAKKNT